MVEGYEELGGMPSMTFAPWPAPGLLPPRKFSKIEGRHVLHGSSSHGRKKGVTVQSRIQLRDKRGRSGHTSQPEGGGKGSAVGLVCLISLSSSQTEILAASRLPTCCLLDR